MSNSKSLNGIHTECQHTVQCSQRRVERRRRFETKEVKIKIKIILSDNGISAIMLNIILTITQYSLLLRLSSSSIASDMAGSCSSWVQHRTLFKRQKWSIFREGTSLNHALRRPTCSQNDRFFHRERALGYKKRVPQKSSSLTPSVVHHHFFD